MTYRRKFVKLILFGMGVFSSNAHAAALERDIHIVFRSFIQKIHPSKSDDTIKTDAGTYVIQAPNLLVVYQSLNNTCFSTDDRNFDSSPTASARTTLEFILSIQGSNMAIKPVPGRSIKRTGVTRNVDCKTGKDLQAPKQASTRNFVIGNVKKHNSSRVVYLKAAASDPFYDKIPAPSVDFNMTITYEIEEQKIILNGSTDDFPAFEGYYSIDNGSTQTIIKRNPAEKATALNLFDGNLGFNTSNFKHEIDISEQ